MELRTHNFYLCAKGTSDGWCVYEQMKSAKEEWNFVAHVS